MFKNVKTVVKYLKCFSSRIEKLKRMVTGWPMELSLWRETLTSDWTRHRSAWGILFSSGSSGVGGRLRLRFE